MNNVVIVPTAPSKPNAVEQQLKSEEKPINEDVNKIADVKDLNTTKKVYSWASNYLQSIGHNNLKPIKINFPSSKIKAPTETVNPDHINYLCNANKNLDVHIQGTPRFSETAKIITPIPNPCMVDTIYSNGNNAIAPAYATLLATRAGESTLYYRNENRSIHIFDAIKSKINSDFDIEQNTRMMDLPNHKEMCENFIKEISKTKTPKKTKADYSSSSSSTKRKSENFESPSPAKKKTKSTKSVKVIEKPVKKDKNHRTKNSEADRVKKIQSQRSTATPDNKKLSELRSNIRHNDCIKKKPITNTNVKLPKRDHKVCEELHKRPEMTSHSSIQSVVQDPENHQTKPRKKPCLDENFDLRSKLSKVNERIKIRKYLQRLKDSNPIINKPTDNLKITVDHQIPEKQKSPKKLGVFKSKPKKCKKLKVIINVVCKESDDDSSSNDSSFSETENNQTQNMDLSFLDDFNVDEIVDSLKDIPITKTAHEKSTIKEIEPELKLTTILSILNAKSESNKHKNLKTDCKAEEVITNSVSSTEPRLVSHAEIKGVAAKENKKQGLQTLSQSTHALEQLLTQNKLQLDQQNTVPYDGSSTKELSTTNTIKKSIDEISDDDKTLKVDECVVYKYPKIEEGSASIIQFEENVTVNDNVINVYNENDIKEHKNHSDIDNQKKIEASQKVNKCMIFNPTKIELNDSIKEINNTEDCVIITEDISIIDLTSETVSNTPKTYMMDLTEDDEIKSNVANITPTSKEPLIKITQPIMQLPLIKTNVDLTGDDEIKSNIANITPTSKEPLIKITQPIMQLPLIKTNVDITEDDEIKSNIANITPTSKEPLIKITPTLMEPLIKTTPTSKELLIKITQPIMQLPLIKTNVDITEDDEIKSSIANVTPTSKDPLIKTTQLTIPLIKTTLTNKKPNKTILPTTAAQMEKEMEKNLHIKMKFIKCIHQGRFSKIFSCKDPSGQTYTAKLLKNKSHQKQEEILRSLQQDIPQHNLNTVFLLDGFAVKTQWCFIMEYYPKTLQQALDAQVAKKPFHIYKVQNLASQLISAVMLLRNNKIIHSDINPTHILLNASQERLKICGFDRAYYEHEANPIPNIAIANYRAPEIILGLSAGYSVDVWASALVIYQMATNQLLFNGIFNNDILYQQMSTFGDLPWDMVEASPFQNQHFRRRIFMRRLGVRVADSVPIYKFFTTKRLHESIISRNKEHWFAQNKFRWNYYEFKLYALTKLLEQMLVLDPRTRLATEFVLLEPFIFDVL